VSAAPQRIGRYELVDRLGEGGMGTLYLARDPALGRTVAIKLLSVRSAELRERFEREARAAAALKHHNIVTIYDVGDEDGQPFIAMEFVAGETLAEIVSRRAPLSPLRKIELLQELCSGLGYAHRSGIVHRDIKPANLMVSAEGPLKILDFGLARVISGPTQPELTRAGVMIGTPHYMSPEQIEGRPIDHRTDIFSVGLVMYELLSYRRAYQGDSPYGVVHRILTSEPDPLDRVSPGIDPALTAIVTRAIQKDPAARYQDLAAFGADLGRAYQRLSRQATEPTIVTPAVPEDSPRAATPPPSPVPSPHPLDRELLTRRRALEIQRQLDLALGHLAAGRLDQAIEACEAAALINPDDERVLSVLRQAQDGRIDRQVSALVGEAEEALGSGSLSRADALLEQAEQLRPEAAQVRGLRQDVERLRLERARLAERARAVRAALDRATASLEQGALESALRSVSEALAHDPDDEAARELRRRVLDAMERRREEEALDRRALECVAEARELFARGEHQAAIDALVAFAPAHAAVESTREELVAERAALENRARDAAAFEQHRAEMQRRQRVAAHKAAVAAALEAGAFDEALDALSAARDTWAADPELPVLEQRILAAQADARVAAERRHAAEQAAGAAEAARAAGDLDGARRLVDSALDADPESARALTLKRTVERAIATRDKQRELDARATEAIAAAKSAFDARRHAEAIDLLARFTPPHPAIAAELASLHERFEAFERARLAQERNEEAARHAKAQAEARDREAARRQRAAGVLASARAHLAEGDLIAARGEVAEALLLWPGAEDALALRESIEQAIRDHRERERIDALARKAIDEAQRLMARHRHGEALRTLEVFQPPHPAVTSALAELRASVASLEDLKPAPEPGGRRHAAPLVAAGGAALLVLALVAGWWLWRPAPTTTPHSEPPPRVDQGAIAVERARQLRADHRIKDAIDALRGHATAPGATAVVAELYREAGAEADRAASDARAGGLGPDAVAAAQQALDRARGLGASIDGVTGMLDAAQAFRTALANATAPETIVADARSAFKAGHFERALDLAASVEQRAPDNAALKALAAEMRSAFERRATELRATAERLGAAGSDFDAAARRADAASRTEGLAAVRAWRETADAYAAVAESAKTRASVYARLDDLIRKNNDAAALVDAERLLAGTPADAHVQQALSQLKSRAAAGAQAAHAQAQAAGASDQWPADMQEGSRQLARSQGANLRAPDEVRALWAARDAFQRAGQTARDATRAAEQVSGLLQRGQRDEAASQLDAALKSYPGSSRVTDALNAAVDAASREAEAARVRSGNAAGTSQYRAAVADELQARRAGRTVDALRGLWRAIDGYRQAMPAAASPTPTPAGGGASTTLDTVRRDVEGILAAIAHAYETKDITEINRLLRDTMEYAQLKQIERNFGEYRSVRWALRLERLELRSDGTVVATCRQTRKIDLKAGRDISDSRTTVLTFRRSGDEWRVISQTYP
jgi:predicted Ser/Thr protein kinase